MEQILAKAVVIRRNFSTTLGQPTLEEERDDGNTKRAKIARVAESRRLAPAQLYPEIPPLKVIVIEALRIHQTAQIKPRARLVL